MEEEYGSRSAKPGPHGEWQEVPPHLPQGRRNLSRAEARRFELVLLSREVPHRIKRLRPDEGGGWTIMVRPGLLETAADEIESYIEENRPRLFRSLVDPDLPPKTGLQATAAVMFCLLMFHALTLRAFPDFDLYAGDWARVGSADAARILGGQWWRAVTALTLHGDWAHVTANVLIGGTLCWLCCRRIGTGAAWLGVVLGGTAGNLVNAYVLGAPHDAVGFSTAVFAAAGILSGARPFAERADPDRPFPERFGRLLREAFVPLAAGLGLLAMLGSGNADGRTDLGAHLFGFACGLPLGILAGWLRRRGIRFEGRDLLPGTAALALPVLCWYLAFAAG